MDFLQTTDPSAATFPTDLLGTFMIQHTVCGLLSFVGRKSVMDRFLVAMHQGKGFYVDGSLIYTLEKGYRVFRRPFAGGYHRAFVLPNGLLIDNKEESSKWDDETNTDDSDSAGSKKPVKEESTLDRYPAIRTVFVAYGTGDRRELLWQKISTLSPIPLLPDWGHEILPLLEDIDTLNTIRIQNGLPSILTPRISFLDLSGPSAENSPFWGAYLDLPVTDIVAVAQHLMQRGRIQLQFAA